MSLKQLTSLTNYIFSEFDFKPIGAYFGAILGGSFLTQTDFKLWTAMLQMFLTGATVIYVVVKIVFIAIKWKRLNEKDID